MSKRMNRVREHRKRLGLTQAQLAERTDGRVDQSALSKIENGIQDLTGELMQILADALGVNPVDLIATAALAEIRDDVEPYELETEPTFAAAMRAKGIAGYSVKTNVLDRIGYAPGAKIAVETTEAAINNIITGDVLVVMARSRTESSEGLILRQYIEPDLLTTHRIRGRNLAISLDDPEFNFEIRGVVVRPS